jgi:hypothetical protein
MMRALAMAAAAALAACEGPVTEIVAPLAVLNWYPSGNATCVPRETGVWVTFSQPVVEETLTDASIGLFQGITPVLAARGYDPDTWTVEIFPDPPLEFGTVYEVRLQPEITAEAGGSFHTVVASSFSTLPQTGCASAFACWTPNAAPSFAASPVRVWTSARCRRIVRPARCASPTVASSADQSRARFHYFF